MSMFLRLVAAVVVLIGAFGAVFMVGMRNQWSPVLNGIKRVNKAFFNPMQMKSAGTEGAYASIIRHVGRTSGTPYETPIGSQRTSDGFLVMLPYGTSPDWLKNVRAAGTAELVHEGHTYAIDDPRIVGYDEASPFLSTKDRKTAKRFGMDSFLMLHNAGTVDG